MNGAARIRFPRFAPRTASDSRSGSRAALLAGLLSLCCANPLQAAPTGADLRTRDAAQMIVVALPDRPDPVVEAGSTPHGYAGLPNYDGSQRSRAEAAKLAREYGLREVSAWTIAPIHLRCMLYEIARGADRAELLTRLLRDPRVRIAQPLHEFTAFSNARPDSAGARTPIPAGPARSADASGGAVAASRYNDPYIGLQRGFREIDAGAAQRWSDGHGVRIAMIDTGVDTNHPDLDERVTDHADFVAPTADPPDASDRHGTEVAGVIAAVANNRLGIVGVAPDARLLAYRACWTASAGEGIARCNTYTIALALGAAIESDARIINLSLGGPPDPLLAELTGYAVSRGTIVVVAVPPDRRMDGFPVAVPGVIAVASAGAPVPSGEVLAAPGNDILTAVPGGHYDYASGSSLAAAHVSGAIALLLELRPRLDADALYVLLKRSQAAPGAAINVCRAGAELRGVEDACDEAAANPLAMHPDAAPTTTD
jgi:subtilisin family serine protease